jgi:hypothetical protein
MGRPKKITENTDVVTEETSIVFPEVTTEVVQSEYERITEEGNRTN